jgi:hypothetical protein
VGENDATFARRLQEAKADFAVKKIEDRKILLILIDKAMSDRVPKTTHNPLGDGHSLLVGGKHSLFELFRVAAFGSL